MKKEVTPVNKLAEYSDVSTDFLLHVETGQNSMSAQNLGEIAAALDVPTFYLIFGKMPYKENVKKCYA